MNTQVFPAHVAAVLGGSWPDWLDAYPTESKDAARRLVADERMKPLWGNCFGAAQFQRAVMEFDHATTRDGWTNKTQRVRDEWKANFEKAVDGLLELMAEAPRTPESWGFPVRDYVLMNVARRMGITLPETGSREFFQEMLRLEAAADAECWTIADALKHYREQQRAACASKQVLKKPGDHMAGRAEFIVWFRGNAELSAQDVATVASVMFQAKDIDGRLVRRLTAQSR